MTLQKGKRYQWEESGTSINKKTGKPNKYVITLEVDGTWKCACPSWCMQKKENWVDGKRVDCQHILRKKIQLGIGVEVPKGSVTITTKMEDDKIYRSITFEDL